MFLALQRPHTISQGLVRNTANSFPHRQQRGSRSVPGVDFRVSVEAGPYLVSLSEWRICFIEEEYPSNSFSFVIARQPGLMNLVPALDPVGRYLPQSTRMVGSWAADRSPAPARSV